MPGDFGQFLRQGTVVGLLEEPLSASARACRQVISKTSSICSVCVTVVVQASSGNRLAAKQRIAVKVVAEFFQEAEDVSDTADCGQG